MGRLVSTLVLLGVLALPACVGGRDDVDRRVGDEGLTVALPAGWHSTAADDGAITDPVTRLVVASSPVTRKQSRCQVAAWSFPADAVALVVVEWTGPAGDVPARPPLFTGRELPIFPAPAIECFDGPGGSVQFVDRRRTFGAYVLVGPRAEPSLVAEARGVLDTLRVDREARRLSRNGYSIAVPVGWDGRILFRDASGLAGVLLQVANFELPENEGLEPPRELPPGHEDPIKAMDAADVLITVTTDEPRGRRAVEPIGFDDLVAVDGRRVPVGHTLREGSFCFIERCLRVEVDFGGAPTDELIERVDEVLASLAVGS